MAYGDGSSTVGVSYIRDAATNLVLMPSLAAMSVPAQPASASLPEETPPPKLGPVEVPPRRNTNSVLSEVDYEIPSFARYGLARQNSSILKRLAGRFGFPQ